MSTLVHPDSVEREGRRYNVFVTADREGMIEYFHLIDTITEELFFEADYEIDALTEEQIWTIVDDFEGSEETNGSGVTAKAQGDQESAEVVERRYFEGILDEQYPFYSDLGEDFREEAIDALRSSRYESRTYQRVLLDELAENYD